MKVALITGANKGIGFETAKQLSQQGFFVYIGSRDIEKGKEAIKKLANNNIQNIKAISLDVTNIETIKSAKNIIEQEQGKLDVLINNAGINGLKTDSNGEYIKRGFTVDADVEAFKEVYETNVFGVIRVTQIFMSLLKKSSEPRIVMVSSALASLTLQNDPTWSIYDFGKFASYSSSKTALNMYAVHLAYELKETSIKVNMVDPGFTQTDLTQGKGSIVEQAGNRIAKYALIDNNGPTGKFFSEEFNASTGIIPW